MPWETAQAFLAQRCWFDIFSRQDVALRVAKAPGYVRTLMELL